MEFGYLLNASKYELVSKVREKNPMDLAETFNQRKSTTPNK